MPHTRRASTPSNPRRTAAAIACAAGFLFALDRYLAPAEASAQPPINTLRLTALIEHARQLTPVDTPADELADIPTSVFTTRYRAPQPVAAATSPPPPPDDPADRETKLRDRLRAEARATLRVQAVLLGNPGLATINGRILRPGDSINGYRLDRVHSNGVTLFRDGVSISLMLEDRP